MKVLVTGAGGMVGSHMVELLHDQGHEVLGTYYKPTTDITELDPDIRMEECDVRYYQAVQRVISEFQPDQIYHLAAQSYPTVSWTHPQATMETNVNGTINVYEAVKFVRQTRPDYDPMVVVACSSAEYGQTLNELEDPYVKEKAELKPLHPYGNNPKEDEVYMKNNSYYCKGRAQFIKDRRSLCKYCICKNPPFAFIF